MYRGYITADRNDADHQLFDDCLESVRKEAENRPYFYYPVYGIGYFVAYIYFVAVRIYGHKSYEGNGKNN